ncbi:MAG: S8 family serine peptidase [Candidatus Eisenbacteria bacterium]
MRVALIDSGINAGHEHVGEVVAGARVLASPDAIQLVEGIEAARDAIGHGTACAGLVRWFAPSAELIAVRVFDSTLRAPSSLLPLAFQYCARVRARLVNLSLGLSASEVEEEARQALDALLAGGAWVVAALGPRARPTWPASHRGVIAVTADPQLDSGSWIWIEDGFMDEEGAIHPLVATAPFPRPMPGQPRERNLAGVSFAAAAVTGLLAREENGVGDPHSLLRAGALERFATRADWLAARGVT